MLRKANKNKSASSGNTAAPTTVPAPSANKTPPSTAAMVTWFKSEKEKDKKNADAKSPPHLTPDQKFSAWAKALQDRELPTAIVDLAAFDRNIAKMQAAVKDTKQTIRVPVKSLRNPYLIKRILDRGHPFKGIMCRNAAEAEFFYDLGIKDILIAYPTAIHKPDVRKLYRMQADDKANIVIALNEKPQLELISKHLADLQKEEAQQLKQIDPDAKAAQRPPLNIVVDLDMSYKYLRQQRGPLRSHILTEDQLKAFLKETRDFPAFKVVGALAYDGVVAGVQDAIPHSWYNVAYKAYNYILQNMRSNAAADIKSRWARTRQIFADEKFEMRIFNGGGTGSIDISSKEEALTEISPGSGALCSHLFNAYSNLQSTALRFEAAAFFPYPVISHPNATTITVAGGALIASGPSTSDKQPVPVFPAGLSLTKDEAGGETNTPLVVAQGKAANIPVGTFVFFRTAKAGEPMERVNEVLLADENDNGQIIGVAPTYRGYGRNFG